MQGPTVQRRELCSVLCGSLDGRGVWRRMNMCVCMSECLHSSPETITTFLLISYTPLQNKKFKIVTNKDLQGTLLNVMWQPGWEGCLEENGYMCIYGWIPSLQISQLSPCTPETIIALLIGYTSIQNKKFFFFKKNIGTMFIRNNPCISKPTVQTLEQHGFELQVYLYMDCFW